MIESGRQTPASQNDIVKLGLIKYQSEKSESSGFSTDSNKKEIHQVKTIVTHISFKVENLEQIMNELSNKHERLCK